MLSRGGLSAEKAALLRAEGAAPCTGKPDRRQRAGEAAPDAAAFCARMAQTSASPSTLARLFQKISRTSRSP